MDVFLVSTYVIQQTVKYKNICRFAAKTSLLNYCLSKQLVVFSPFKADLENIKILSVYLIQAAVLEDAFLILLFQLHGTCAKFLKIPEYHKG